jgi:glyoxylase-like metal-dependent hydrolase (beta-lactamase superfamily II)
MKISEKLHAFIWRDMRMNNCNTYLIDGNKKILVDPGHRQAFRFVEQELADIGLSVDQIDVVLITHGHPDHMEAAQLFSKSTSIAMGELEKAFFDTMSENFPMARNMGLPAFDFYLQEGELTIGDDVFQVIHTPGHSPGSICLYQPDSKALICGDVVFNQGIGRTDLPGGNGKLLKESIQRLSSIDTAHLLPGHGEIISGREAVNRNFKLIESQWFPYLR